MAEGMTALELGDALFRHYEFSCSIKEPGCPFANGTADFIGRNNDSYARKFCAPGCCPDCTKIMIEGNRVKYDRACKKLREGKP